jgi:FtsZ-binding cell division protein ZapB
MNNQIKFTSDGRKVAVIGKLNAQETIVQEIFIVGESEIPSGENFVVKSLHDAVAISWKDVEIKRLKEQNERLISNLKSENKQYEDQLNKRRQQFKEQSKILSDKFKFIAASIKNADESSFNALLSFLEGRIKYVIINHNYAPTIVDFVYIAEKYSDNDYWSGINLISLFGKDDGTLQYKVFDYYDGYKSHTDVIPFETYKEALLKLTDLINNLKEYNDDTLKSAKQHNIQLDSEKLSAYKEKISKHIIANIESSKLNIERHQKRIEEIDQLG